MSVLYLDFETVFDRPAGLTLERMTLRGYLQKAPIIGFSFALDDGPIEWVPAQDRDVFLDTLAEIDAFGQDPTNVVCAYNVAFDTRVLRFGRLDVDGEPLGGQHPLRIQDAMELSMAAWPNQPGGYGLKNIAQWLHLPPKLDIEDARKGRCTWAEYCNRDTELLRIIHQKALKRVPPPEVRLCEMANALRGLHYEIHADTVRTSMDAFVKNTKEGVEAALAFLSSTGRDGAEVGDQIFGGFAEGAVRSVKAKALRNLLVETLGFDTTTTSLKKINPAYLVERPDVAELLTATSKANKGLYYQKRAASLVGVSQVDMELGYYRATATGRYSAPGSGKSINVHNLTKKDKTIAKPLRQMLALPDDLCYVRADAANVEYRIEGLLTGCKYVEELFSTNIDADPYGAFAKEGFGVEAKKGQPLRDVVAKAAVLGYGYAMGKGRAIEELNRAVADPANKVSIQDIEKLCGERGWGPPKDRYLKGIQTRLKCKWPIVTAANEARDAFHGLHCEFFTTADWLMLAVEKLAGARTPTAILDYLYSLPGAPKKEMISLSIDPELEFPSVRVTVLGHCMPTVTWRHLSCSHPGVDGLGAVTANKGPRNVHRALLIENVCQSAARNALVRAKLELRDRGYPHIMSIHDEILLIVPRERNTVLQAREDLLEVMSPRGPLGLKWAFYAKRSECTVTRTLYEDEAEASKAWAKLEANDPTWTDHLT